MLTFQIKRFVSVPGKEWLMKNDTIVDYPREMKLGDSSYELYALINHIGALAGGHYVTVCKQSVTEKWFCFDDDTTSEVTINNREKSRQAYILFYKKKEILQKNKIKVKNWKQIKIHQWKNPPNRRMEMKRKKV